MYIYCEPSIYEQNKNSLYNSVEKYNYIHIYTMFAIVFSMLTVTPTEQTCDPFLSANQLVEKNWSI